MKNLRIGAKFFVAFSIVIAFMLLSAAVVFVANMGIVGNVEKISADAILQTEVSSLKDNFLLTRITSTQLLSTTDKAVYDSFVKQADIVTQSYAKVYSDIDDNPSLNDYRPSFAKAESDYKAYLAKSNELGKANMDEEEQIARMGAAGAVMEEYGDLIFRDQVELLREEINGEGVARDAQLRRVDRIVTGADIALTVLEFRMYAGEMMVSFDTASMPKALELIDKAYSITEEYNKASSIPKNIENSQMLMDAIAEYRAALVKFGDVCDTASKIATELVPLGDASLDSLSAASALLESTMSSHVGNTSTSASSSLIMVMSISLISILVAVALATVIVKSITVPVSKMVSAADSLATGDVNVDTHYDSKDEIGMLSASFEKMLEGIKAQATAVDSLANGDLTVNIRPRSDKDVMGRGLKKMADGLNGMFGEINAVTEHVSAGARQIADTSQILSQGSTEQAAAVERLSASINEVADKTGQNVDIAKQAADLTSVIRGNAEKGAAQMNQMMQAVREINEASQSIGKVIKVIDDIAFQTNILALNAAVEAARAGQHGKGFAVVADEVRNLAGKSAEAAKETGGLIENSVNKATLGLDIATQTSDSLREIVEGINASADIVLQIAHLSDEQAGAIGQINSGIEQVTQVVQQNSSTAEETAAASEEMNSQASLLGQLMARFKLKDMPALPAISRPAVSGSTSFSLNGGSLH